MFAATQKSDAEDMMLEAAWSVPVGTSETLARIARRGYLTARRLQGRPRAFAADCARRIRRLRRRHRPAGSAAVILGRADAVRFTPLGSGDRFTAIVSGAIDLGVYNASCSLCPASSPGASSPPSPSNHGESALVRRATGGLETLLDFREDPPSPSWRHGARRRRNGNRRGLFRRPRPTPGLRKYTTLPKSLANRRLPGRRGVMRSSSTPPGSPACGADLPDRDAHRILAERNVPRSPNGPRDQAPRTRSSQRRPSPGPSPRSCSRGARHRRPTGSMRAAPVSPGRGPSLAPRPPHRVRRPARARQAGGRC